ncbi:MULTISPECIES: dihydroneopterin aldolase [unclassified Novosphingobium]|uniref:dihydroneopterin aldolase n=1 Tax=unclassified Novosphingobium TaxID=2644732 RepID=UPI000EC0A5EC|nr:MULTISPECIES: dihydroneopterin aldolase [unclassified Novosphingobium]HCF25007.1 dihydroneopterin aldolase [Novosphingobium sp.]HQV03653.1 dihydroneopterin aldolase [Novosphingobium sp.]
MRYLLFLDSQAVELSIGLHDFERAAKQRILVSAALVVERDPGAGDDGASIWDYDSLRQAIFDLASGAHIELQETLCSRLAEFCQSQNDIVGGWVRTAKPDVYPDAKAVGCQMAWGDGEAMALLAQLNV